MALNAPRRPVTQKSGDVLSVELEVEAINGRAVAVAAAVRNDEAPAIGKIELVGPGRLTRASALVHQHRGVATAELEDVKIAHGPP